MDKTYRDNVGFSFIKVIMFIILLTPLLISIGYIAIQNLEIHYFLYAFIYGQLAIIFIKLIFEHSKRTFISDVIEHRLEPILKFEYEQEEWNNFIKKVLKKKIKRNFIISMTILLISIILIIIGYDLKNDGEFALAIGYNLLMLSLFWGLNNYIFIIYPLSNALHSKIKEIQCFKYGLILMDNHFVLKTFNYIKNIHLVEIDNEINICFTDETRGTSVEGNDANVITKTHIPIPKKNKNDSDKIYVKAFRKLM
ncbi:hypothetical protein [Aquimarina mytili]|uniref:Uncharacterized protein n=1 Tax=Aquimarina mytili TaxID=874423 RepID=A0A936ZWW3_9FLAO|nr:hypothetical protein [Aquimarina mytili]MBL0686163.1 hypothetical protein [Aquimarina mytili]